MGVILPSVPPDDVLADDVLAKYIEAAMEDATFVIFVEDETCYGDIYGFDGVWANADTLEECRKELAEVLEGWIILGIELGHEIPVLPSIDLMPKEKTA
jgi:predicted RNase H-like HicB family nuclease